MNTLAKLKLAHLFHEPDNRRLPAGLVTHVSALDFFQRRISSSQMPMKSTFPVIKLKAANFHGRMLVSAMRGKKKKKESAWTQAVIAKV